MQSVAFLGDPALKAEILKRVDKEWETGRITPSVYLKWSEDGFTSLAGAIGRTQDPDEFNAATGLPIDLALLCETLINAGIFFDDDAAAPMGFAMHGDDRILSFAMEWLNAIPVGRDLGDAVARFLPVFLNDVISGVLPSPDPMAPSVRKVAGEILGLWSIEGRGGVVSRQTWQSVRSKALRAADGTTDCATTRLVESLAWPRRGIASEFPAICREFLHRHQRAMALQLLANPDRRVWTACLAAERELAQLRREPQFASLADASLMDRFPHIRTALGAAQQPAIAARIDDAMRQARSLMVPVLRRQMDALLVILRERPG